MARTVLTHFFRLLKLVVAKLLLGEDLHLVTQYRYTFNVIVTIKGGFFS